MNQLSLNNNEKIVNIKNKIFKIRGVEVMLDSDLAELYGVETKRINEAVKNNPLKFPKRFCFRITEKEYISLKSKISTSKGGSRKGHTVFTEQGALMLGTILKSKEAVQTSIDIMDAFVLMRKTLSNIIDYKSDMYLIQNTLIEHNYKLLEHDSKLNEIFDNFKEKKEHIFFEGQIYDAYSLLLSIFDGAKEELIIIDNYINHKVLDLVSRLKIKVIIVSKNMNEELINKYNKQYHNLEIIKNDSFHDRFIIIDRKELYISGSSLKDIGTKCFGIYKVEDNKILNGILNIL